MLARNFKTATDLGISDAQKDALIKTLVLMETGKLKHIPERSLKPVMWEDAGDFAGLFNMCFTYARNKCGTAACIRGTAQMISGIDFDIFHLTPSLHELFYDWTPCGSCDPTVEHAATALRSYLTNGDPRWDLAILS